MKRRNREVNIFSVSLMDILCGALGAFCFMTIVLLPYYSPEAAGAKELKQKQAAMQAELEKLRGALGSTPGGQQALQQLQELERRIQNLQGDLNRKSKELEDAEKKARALQARNPVVVILRWETKANLDLYVRTVDLSGKRSAPAMDPAKFQYHPYPGDAQLGSESGPSVEVMLSRDAPQGWAFDVYYKWRAGDSASGSTDARGFFMNEGKLIPLPAAALAGPGSGVYAGRLTPQVSGLAKFEAAPELALSYQKDLEAWSANNR